MKEGLIVKVLSHRARLAQVGDSEVGLLQQREIILNGAMILRHLLTQPLHLPLTREEVIIDDPILSRAISAFATAAIAGSDHRMLDAENETPTSL